MGKNVGQIWTDDDSFSDQPVDLWFFHVFPHILRRGSPVFPPRFASPAINGCHNCLSEAEAEPDPLLLAWARLAGVGRAFPPEKWQDRPRDE